MATTKAAGSTKLGRDSRSKRLGVKKFASEKVTTGNIIVRQKGTKYLPGEGVKLGSDFTIYAASDGVVKYDKKRVQRFTGKLIAKTVVSVEKT